jgi:hypothetical protein
MAAGAICAGCGAVQWYVSCVRRQFSACLAQVNFGWALRRYAFVRVRASGKGLSHDLFGPSLDSGNSLCYRTEPFRGGIFGRIAQLVEQLTLNQRVPGSSPGAPTKQNNDLA